MQLKISPTDTSNSHFRTMTEAERSQLQQALVQVPHPRKRYLKAALNIAVFWIFLLAGLCLAWFILSLILADLANIDVGPSGLYASTTFTLLIILAAFFAINSTRRWLKSSPNEYALIKADLKSANTTVDTYHVKAMKCFKEPQFGGLIYFLLLQPSDSLTQKIRVIYDYASQQQTDPSKLLTIKDTLTLSFATHSGYVYENEFKGEDVSKREEYELTLAPEFWPNADSWLIHDWQSITTIYAIKKEKD